MASQSSSSKGGIKRKLDFEDSQHDHGLSDEMKIDGHLSTPNKKRLDYDYWNPSSQESTSDSQSESLNFANLQVGQYLNKSIRFRVTLKSAIKSTRIGNVFAFHGIDSSGEIAFVAYREEANKFFEIVKVNEVYELTNFKTQEESKKYPSGCGHNLQINFVHNSFLVSTEKEDGIPGIPLKIISLKEIGQFPVKTLIDTIGILVKDWTLESTSRGFTKRDLSITDSSKTTINITLWGVEAEKFDADTFSIIALRKAVVSEYLGSHSLNCNHNTLLWNNPDIPEATELHEWFKSQPRPHLQQQ